MARLRSILDLIQNASALTDAEDANGTTAKVTASGDTAFVSVNLEAKADQQGGTSVVSATAIVETDDTKVTTTGDAAASGETADTSIVLAASIDEQTAKGSASATAEAEPGDGTEDAFVMATTDAEVTGPVTIIADEDTTTTETEPDLIRETASSYVLAERVNPEDPEVTLESEEVFVGDDWIEFVWLW
jgi:hypothetical protein